MISVCFVASGIAFLGVCLVVSTIHNQIDPPVGHSFVFSDRWLGWGIASGITAVAVFIIASIVGTRILANRSKGEIDKVKSEINK